MSGADTSDDSWCMHVGERTIRASVRVSTRGTEERPLLLVNGLGAALDTWEPLRAALGARRTIAFDAPGTGGSSTPLRPLTIRELAGLALEVVAQLGHEEVDVLGYSFGGAVAQELARLAPERVRRMVLAATSFGWGAPLGDPFAMIAAASGSASLAPRPDPLGYWWQLLAISAWSSFPWISRVQQRTLVLAGAHDRVAPVAAARLLARELPHAELAVVDGEHSFLIRDGAAEAAALITEFLARDQLPEGPPEASAEGPLVCT